MIQAIEVKRDETGCWWHPDMPEFEEGDEEEWSTWIVAQQLELSRGMLGDMPDDHPAYIEYFENGEPNFSAWIDEPPRGEGWFTLAISDTEDGPVWCWARHKQVTEEVRG